MLWYALWHARLWSQAGRTAGCACQTHLILPYLAWLGHKQVPEDPEMAGIVQSYMDLIGGRPAAGAADSLVCCCRQRRRPLCLLADELAMVSCPLAECLC